MSGGNKRYISKIPVKNTHLMHEAIDPSLKQVLVATFIQTNEVNDPCGAWLKSSPQQGPLFLSLFETSHQKRF